MRQALMAAAGAESGDRAKRAYRTMIDLCILHLSLEAV